MIEARNCCDTAAKQRTLHSKKKGSEEINETAFFLFLRIEK